MELYRAIEVKDGTSVLGMDVHYVKYLRTNGIVA